MELLKGAEVAKAICARLQETILAKEGVRAPKLAIIRVGERADDLSYERGATKRMDSVGIAVESFVFPADITHEEFLAAFDQINENPDIDGILLLRPLPNQINEKLITERIDPKKDVDCISPMNMAKVFMGDHKGFAPCTAQAVVEMLTYTGMPLAGKTVAVIGRSLVVGRPLAMLLMQKNATVTICHTKTVDMAGVCKNADIVVACAGQMRMVDPSYVSAKTKAVMDVGINFDPVVNKLCGDVDFDAVSSVLSEDCYITPVPGGVGAVTTSVLADHVVRAWSDKVG